MAADIRQRRFNKTEYTAQIDEKDVEWMLAQHVATLAGVKAPTQGDGTYKVFVENKDADSRGPYKVYKVTVTEKHEGDMS